MNIGTGVVTVNIDISTSRNAALMGRRLMQYTKSSIKLHHPTLSELKFYVFRYQTFLPVSQYLARFRNNTQTRISEQILIIIRCKHVLT